MLSHYKALIIAAGLGSRIGGRKNKCLSEINGKPLLQHTIDNFSLKGIGDITIITGYDRESVEQELTGQVNLVYNPKFADSGILRSVWCARERIKNHPFVFTSGDHFFDSSLLDLFKDFNEDIGVVVEKKDCDSEDVKTVIRNSKIYFGKELPAAKAVGELTGLMIFSKKASENFFTLLNERITEFENKYVFHLLMLLQERGMIITPLYCKHNSRIEIDYAEDLDKARLMVQK